MSYTCLWIFIYSMIEAGSWLKLLQKQLQSRVGTEMKRANSEMSHCILISFKVFIIIEKVQIFANNVFMGSTTCFSFLAFSLIRVTIFQIQCQFTNTFRACSSVLNWNIY